MGEYTITKGIPQIFPMLISLLGILISTCAILLIELLSTRKAIRKHRDQRLDDRCWMDDFEIYEVLPEGLKGCVDSRLLPKEEMIRNCEHYINFRAIESSPEVAIANYKKWRDS